MLVLSNAFEISKHSGDAGYRASFASYVGLWTIEWPIGKPAVARLSIHDLPSRPGSEKYPQVFPQRVDKCIDMLAGVIIDSACDIRVAFPGRKAPGTYILELQKKGFPGAHGSRHFYNMVGGKVFEFDYLFPRRIIETSQLQPAHKSTDGGDVVYASRSDKQQVRLTVPSRVTNEPATVVLEHEVLELLPQLLDRVPWTHLSWSMHRGMRDILLAFGKNTMNMYRPLLATKLRQAVRELLSNPKDTKGWDPDFVRDSMPDMVYTTVTSGSGESGDLIRVITDAALLLYDGNDDGLDRTSFWTTTMQSKHIEENPPPEIHMSSDTIVALTKFVVLEWSQEFDYQMYHHLPIELFFE
ncbi:hypothetical protein VMCG_04180 [Cytospora schulzeri]|uniref:Uncharacterized protein n=1 Tax=Cytospora schulzeri TaxID=448051 RepID=A0A423WU55_9PEZI|nr:hypothetical protein VMCG_04180 [Valsa malicola]